MIASLGQFALILAWVVAVVQAGLSLAGAVRAETSWIAAGRRASYMQLALALTAFGLLIACFVRSDFSVASVAAYSHTDNPLLYKIGAVWGHHEGSLLLWIVILAGFGAAIARFGRALPTLFHARAVGVQGIISLGFLSFLLLTSSPFLRLDPAPPNGDGFNPLLQDPALVIHPPMLYLGYVGFSVPFAFAVAALLSPSRDLAWAAWARWVRPWALASWSFLTAGIGLGSWWAYYELGWGGWWFWDPVENASFMPWLLGTALIHSTIVTEKRDALKSWTCLLAILTFGLSILGTFLVRSGVLTSVHSFANDPARGIFILTLMGILIGGALMLYAWRAPTLTGGGTFRPISREGGLLLNNLVLTTACVTVLLGTLYPLIVEALSLSPVSVGTPYYAKTFVPLMLPFVAAVAIGSRLPWKRGDLRAILPGLTAAFILALLVMIWAVDGTSAIPSLIGLGVGVFLLCATLHDLARRLFVQGQWRRLPSGMLGMSVAHAGFAVAVIAMAGATAWREEISLTLMPGQSQNVGLARVTFEKIQEVDRGDHVARQAILRVQWHDEAPRLYTPERRAYRTGGAPTSEASILTDGITDRHAVLGEPDGAGHWVVRLYRQPMVPIIWLGGLIMVAGGILSLLDRRLRLALPARRATAAVTTPMTKAAE